MTPRCACSAGQSSSGTATHLQRGGSVRGHGKWLRTAKRGASNRPRECPTLLQPAASKREGWQAIRQDAGRRTQRGGQRPAGQPDRPAQKPASATQHAGSQTTGASCRAPGAAETAETGRPHTTNSNQQERHQRKGRGARRTSRPRRGSQSAAPRETSRRRWCGSWQST